MPLLLDLAQAYKENGEHVSPAKALRRVIAEEPTREEAHAHLLHIHAPSDNLAAALESYEHMKEVLSGTRENAQIVEHSLA